MKFLYESDSDDNYKDDNNVAYSKQKNVIINKWFNDAYIIWYSLY